MSIPNVQIAAMAVAAIAKETKEDISNLRIVSFKEIRKSNLEKYLEENQICFKKYQIGDQK